MKYAIIFLIPMLLGCYVSNKKMRTLPVHQGEFMYVLPFSVEKKIYSLMKERNLVDSLMFFVLHNYGSYFQLLGNKSGDLKNVEYGFLKIAHTGRYLLIDDRTYPIVLDVDYIFGSRLDSMESIEKRELRRNEEGLSISRGPYVINEQAISVKFTRTGKILD